MVPPAKTSAPDLALYLTAPTVPGWPGGGALPRIRPSSTIQELSLTVWTLVAKTRSTPAGSYLRYWAWVGTASHSQPISGWGIEVELFLEIPVLRQTGLPAYSFAALAAGIVSGKFSESLSPTYMIPKSWFSGMSGPTRPPAGADGSPSGAPLSRHVVVAFIGLSSAVPAFPSGPRVSSAVPLIPSGPQSFWLICPLAPEPPPSTVL